MEFRLINRGVMYESVRFGDGIAEFVGAAPFRFCDRANSQVRRDFTPLVSPHAVGYDKQTPIGVHGVLVVGTDPALVGRSTPGQPEPM
tara:strand:+ start:189 stop:452 length:264 start_codon:yes stop_codon:yes gene_type:complete